MLAIRDKVLEEVNLLPEEKLNEIYNIIISYRAGLKKKKNKKTIMNFAGIWKDMSEKNFDNLSNEIESRRKNASGLRRNFETNIS